MISFPTIVFTFALLLNFQNFYSFKLNGVRKFPHSILKMQNDLKNDEKFFPFSRKSFELSAKKDKDMSGGFKGGENARQLLGVKGGTKSDNIWAIRLQLCKPVTWIPLIWGVACGAGNEFIYKPYSPLR